METKVCAIDVYGTILNIDDNENVLGPRKGFKDFVSKCKSLNLKLVTISDAYIPNLIIDLETSFKNSRTFLEPVKNLFDNFY